MVARPPPGGGEGAGAAAAGFGLAPGVQGLAPLGTPGAAGAPGGVGGAGTPGGLFVKHENGYLDGGAGGAPGGAAGLSFQAGEGPGALHLHLSAGAGQLAGMGGAAGGLKLEGDPLASPAAGALGGAGGLGAGMGPSGQLAGAGVVLRGAPAAGYAGLVRASAPQPRGRRVARPSRLRRGPSRRFFQSWQALAAARCGGVRSRPPRPLRPARRC